jgi:hypothetical protein
VHRQEAAVDGHELRRQCALWPSPLGWVRLLTEGFIDRD